MRGRSLCCFSVICFSLFENVTTWGELSVAWISAISSCILLCKRFSSHNPERNVLWSVYSIDLGQISETYRTHISLRDISLRLLFWSFQRGLAFKTRYVEISLRYMSAGYVSDICPGSAITKRFAKKDKRITKRFSPEYEKRNVYIGVYKRRRLK